MTGPQDTVRDEVVFQITRGLRFGWDSTRAERVEATRQLLSTNHWTARTLARRIGVTERSAYRYLKEIREENSQ